MAQKFCRCRICTRYEESLIKTPPKEGDLRVWWIPQVPGQPYYVPVKSLREAHLVLSLLADYDFFQLYHRIKPDYSNAGGLEVFLIDSDGEGTPGWCEWENEDGHDIDDVDDEG
ncbi:MAG: hypothetical protein QUS07_07225 [Methanothrix sp.]|nr:hypothetical protein [Methanothrix sp.]